MSGMKGKTNFYEAFLKSEGGFFTEEEQEKISKANILIAGVGSVGSTTVMSLVKSGFGQYGKVVFLDPDVVEIENLGRQEYTMSNIGKNKAKALEENIKAVNPYVNIEALSDGINKKNVWELVANSDVIVDAVDIRALDMMYYLHYAAWRLKKTVVVGYDLGGTSLVVVYRYDKDDIMPLDGVLVERDLERFYLYREAYKDGRISDSDFLTLIYTIFNGVLSPWDVPIEQVEELVNRSYEDDNTTYQLANTSRSLGSLLSETVRFIVIGRDVRTKITYDRFSTIVPTSVRMTNSIRKIVLLIWAWFTLNRNEKGLLDKVSRHI